MLPHYAVLFVNHNLILTGYCNIDYTESASTSPDPFQLGAITANGAVVSKAVEIVVVNIEIWYWLRLGNVMSITFDQNKLD